MGFIFYLFEIFARRPTPALPDIYSHTINQSFLHPINISSSALTMAAPVIATSKSERTAGARDVGDHQFLLPRDPDQDTGGSER